MRYHFFEIIANIVSLWLQAGCGIQRSWRDTEMASLRTMGATTNLMRIGIRSLAFTTCLWCIGSSTRTAAQEPLTDGSSIVKQAGGDVIEIVGAKSIAPNALWDSVVSAVGSPSIYACAPRIQSIFGFYDVAVINTPLTSETVHSLVMISEQSPGDCRSAPFGGETTGAADSLSLALVTNLSELPIDLSSIFRSHHQKVLGDSAAAAVLSQRVVDQVVRIVPAVQPTDVTRLIDAFHEHLDRANGDGRHDDVIASILSEPNDTVRAARAFWVASLEDRGAAWRATFRLLNDRVHIVRFIALQLLDYLSMADSNLSHIDFNASVPDLRCIIAGNNLFALHPLVELLIRAQAPRDVVASVLDNNRQLISHLLRVEQKETRDLIARFVAMAGTGE